MCINVYEKTKITKTLPWDEICEACFASSKSNKDFYEADLRPMIEGLVPDWYDRPGLGTFNAKMFLFRQKKSAS